MSYYFKISKEKNLNANDRLYILDRLRQKYRETEFDLTELYAEINRQTTLKQKEPKKKMDAFAPTTEVPSPFPNQKRMGTARKGESEKGGTLTKALVTESKNFSRLLLDVPGTSQYKDILKKDEKGREPPVIVLYLYNTQEKLKASSKNFAVKSGVIRQVQSKMVAFNPPAVRVSVSLREDRSYRISKNGDQLMLTVEKSRRVETPKGDEQKAMDESALKDESASPPETIPVTGAAAPMVLASSETQTSEKEPAVPISEAPAEGEEASFRAKLSTSAMENFVTVSGAVQSEGRVEFRDKMTVMQAIYLAGGFKEKVRAGPIRLMRDENGKKIVQEIDLKELLKKLPEGDTALKAGDFIIVSAKESPNRKSFNRNILPWFIFIGSLGAVLGLLI